MDILSKSSRIKFRKIQRTIFQNVTNLKEQNPLNRIELTQAENERKKNVVDIRVPLRN